MKLGEARRITSEHLNNLYHKKKELTDLLKDDQAVSSSYDRVELSKALAAIEKEYEQTQEVADDLNTVDAAIQNAEAARQQGEAMMEAAEELFKILEIFRRISKGDHVPMKDENKLLEYSHELYMTAKNMALMSQNAKAKKHKSLWEDEEPQEEPLSPSEVASNVEVGDPLAGVTASSSSSEGHTSAE